MLCVVVFVAYSSETREEGSIFIGPAPSRFFTKKIASNKAATKTQAIFSRNFSCLFVSVGCNSLHRCSLRIAVFSDKNDNILGKNTFILNL